MWQPSGLLRQPRLRSSWSPTGTRQAYQWSGGSPVREFGRLFEASGSEQAYPRCIRTPFGTRAARSCCAKPKTFAWCKNSCAMRTCKQQPATPGSPSRIFGRDWKRSAARGNEKGIHVPPPGALKFWGEKHHEITVVAPTGCDRTTSFLQVDFGGVGLAA